MEIETIICLIAGCCPLVVAGTWYIIECIIYKHRKAKIFKQKYKFYEERTIKNYNLMDSSEQINVLKVIVNQSITDDEAKSLFYLRNNKITFSDLFNLYNRNTLEFEKAKNTKRLEIEASGIQNLPKNITNIKL